MVAHLSYPLITTVDFHIKDLSFCVGRHKLYIFVVGFRIFPSVHGLYHSKSYIHTELCPNSQYFSTTFTTPPKRRPEARNFSPSLSLLTVIVAAESRLLVTSCSTFSRPSLISHQDKVFDSIPLADSTSPDSTSPLSSSIFLLPIYLSNGIPCTFIHCQFLILLSPQLLHLPTLLLG